MPTLPFFLSSPLAINAQAWEREVEQERMTNRPQTGLQSRTNTPHVPPKIAPATEKLFKGRGLVGGLRLLIANERSRRSSAGSTGAARS